MNNVVHSVHTSAYQFQHILFNLQYAVTLYAFIIETIENYQLMEQLELSGVSIAHAVLIKVTNNF